MYVRFEVFMAMKIHIVVLRVVTPCSDVVGHQWWKMEAAWSSRMPTISLHGVTTHETTTFILIM